ncbi:hypothetical protein BB560_006196 [Smittium megazygosporum]|uniref:Uncharacterized protein n=1 Tax=Smittium megazygosporum TaxID=133381 RepID=A0A2T9YDT6_9FUNG|nr:hypothetical protein BB560_006196 [Smittium megazygosporum]
MVNSCTKIQLILYRNIVQTEKPLNHGKVFHERGVESEHGSGYSGYDGQSFDQESKSHEFDGFYWFALETENILDDYESSSSQSSSDSDSSFASDFSSDSYLEAKSAHSSSSNTSSLESLKNKLTNKTRNIKRKERKNHTTELGHRSSRDNIDTENEKDNIYISKETKVSQLPHFSIEEWNQSGLSLLECMLKLAGLEMTLQTSHLNVTGQTLHLFLSDISSVSEIQKPSLKTSFLLSSSNIKSNIPSTPSVSSSKSHLISTPSRNSRNRSAKED